MKSPRSLRLIQQRSGFTLIELIIVIAILVGLAGIVLISVNPTGRLQQAYLTQEVTSADQMTKALNLKIVDEFATLNEIADGVTEDICKFGESVGCVNLDGLVTEGYLAAIPVTQEYESIPIFSGYQIFREGGYVEICPRGSCSSSGGNGSSGGASSSSQSSSSSSSSSSSFSGPFAVAPNQTTDEGSSLPIINIGQFNVADTSVGSYTYSINWDDGMPEDTGPATIDSPTSGSFDGSHVYADNGVYTVTVILFLDTILLYQDTFTITVANVAPTLTATSDRTYVAGEAFSIMDIGVFSDPAFDNLLNVGGETTETFSFTIEWEDGVFDSGPPTIDVLGSPGIPTSGSFDGSYQYSNIGEYTVTITIIDDDGIIPVVDTFQVTVTGPMGSNLYFPDQGSAAVPYQQLFDFNKDEPFSLSFWLKPGTSPTGNVINYFQFIGTYGAFNISLTNNSRNLFVRFNPFGNISWIGDTEVFTSGGADYYHVVITYDGVFELSTPSNIQLYIDGINESLSLSAFLGAMSGLNRLVIGNASAGNGVLGNMDDLRVYDRDLSLTPADITALADTSIGNDPTNGLVHHWNFNENGGTTINDSIGTANGSLSGPQWSTDAPF